MAQNYFQMMLFAVLLHVATANDVSSSGSGSVNPSWLVNFPPSFHSRDSSHHDLGRLLDVRADPVNMSVFDRYIKDTVPHVDDQTGGENVDAIEQFLLG